MSRAVPDLAVELTTLSAALAALRSDVAELADTDTDEADEIGRLRAELVAQQERAVAWCEAAVAAARAEAKPARRARAVTVADPVQRTTKRPALVLVEPPAIELQGTLDLGGVR